MSTRTQLFIHSISRLATTRQGSAHMDKELVRLESRRVRRAASIPSRSYVLPSSATTGSCMSEWRIGQQSSSGSPIKRLTKVDTASAARSVLAPELTQTLTRKPEFRKENEDSRPEDVSERAIGLHSACVVEPRCHSRNSPQVNRNIAPAVFVGPKAYERAIGRF